MRNAISALVVSIGVAMSALFSSGSAQAAVFSSPQSRSGVVQASEAMTQVRHRYVRPRFGIYFGFHVGPRYPGYWFPGPYYYPYPSYYYHPYYDVPRYYRRCWRNKRTGRTVCRLYRRW